MNIYEIKIRFRYDASYEGNIENFSRELVSAKNENDANDFIKVRLNEHQTIMSTNLITLKNLSRIKKAGFIVKE